MLGREGFVPQDDGIDAPALSPVRDTETIATAGDCTATRVAPSICARNSAPAELLGIPRGLFCIIGCQRLAIPPQSPSYCGVAARRDRAIRQHTWW